MKHFVEEIELKSGAKGLLIDVPDATVMSTRIHFRAGMAYAKSPDVHEIAHVMEHLSFGANSKYHNEQAFEAEFTKNGAYHNAWTGDTSICYETECADFEWDRILKLQQLSITSPRFNSEELNTEKRTIQAELTGYMEEYPRLLWPRLQRAVGEDVPDLRARIKTLPNIEQSDIREHYRRTHTAHNMRFIIAGQMHRRRRTIIKVLEDWDLKPGKRLPLPHYDLHSSPAVNIRRKDASSINFGFSWITKRHLEMPQLAAMGCLNNILTGTMNSRIFGQARQRGLTYGTDCSCTSSPYASSWDFGGKVNPESAEELFDLIRDQLVNVLNGDITDEELEAAKSYKLGRFQMGAQTVNQIADYYTGYYFGNNEIPRYDTTPDVIKNIKKSDMIDLAREFVDSNIHALVTVSSVEKSLIDTLASKLRI